MDPIYVAMAGGGAAAAVGFLTHAAYKMEFWRRGVITERLRDFASLRRYKVVSLGEQQSEFKINLRRVFWSEQENSYVNANGKPLTLIPLKTITLNFHWSICMDRVNFTGKSVRDLHHGVRVHVNKEGIKLGADAFFITEESNAHGNPIYSVAFFKFPNPQLSSSGPLLEDIKVSRDTSSTPSS